MMEWEVRGKGCALPGNLAKSTLVKLVMFDLFGPFFLHSSGPD